MIARKKSKIMVLILTLTLLLSMGGVANAAEPRNIEEGSTATIVVDGVENSGTVTAYKVINVNFDTTNQQPQDPVYTWDANVAEWLRGHDTYKSYVEKNGNGVTTDFTGASDIEQFVDDLANAIKSGRVSVGISKEKTWSDNTDGSYKFEGMGMGAYLILVTEGVDIYSPVFTNVYPSFDTDGWKLAAPRVNVSPKSETPGLVKDVDDPTVAIGDTVKYTVTITVPQYPNNALDKRFAFGDTLPEGLSLVGDSVKIYAGSTEDADNEITTYFEATKKEELDEGVTFEYYAKDYDNLMREHPGLTTILVTYNAAVDSDAYDYKDGMVNTAYLEYDNDPYDDTGYRTIEDNEIVYTYALEITKRNDDGEEVVYLPGAEFTLKRHDPEGTMKFVEESSGIYHVASQDEIEDEEIDTVDRVVSNIGGIIQIKGLDVGSYTLTEVKAPEGYTLPSNPNTTITLFEGETPDGKLDKIEANGTEVITGSVGVDDIDDNQGNVGISNSTSDFDLPQTGGIGTVIFTVAGILIMSGAVILLVTASKKKSNHK